MTLNLELLVQETESLGAPLIIIEGNPWIKLYIQHNHILPFYCPEKVSLRLNTSIMHLMIKVFTVLPTKSDSDAMFCLQSYQELIIDR